MRIVTQSDVAYFQGIIRRYAEGVHPAPADFDAAQAAKCHDNAEVFFSRHPDHLVVRGWLVAEIGGAPGFFRLVAHSINQSPSGAFIDVTPLEEADRKAYCFVPHLGSDGEFAGMKERFVETYFPFIDAGASSTWCSDGQVS